MKPRHSVWGCRHPHWGINPRDTRLRQGWRGHRLRGPRGSRIWRAWRQGFLRRCGLRTKQKAEKKIQNIYNMNVWIQNSLQIRRPKFHTFASNIVAQDVFDTAESIIRHTACYTSTLSFADFTKSCLLVSGRASKQVPIRGSFWSSITMTKS